MVSLFPNRISLLGPTQRFCGMAIGFLTLCFFSSCFATSNDYEDLLQTPRYLAAVKARSKACELSLELLQNMDEKLKNSPLEPTLKHLAEQKEAIEKNKINDFLVSFRAYRDHLPPLADSADLTQKLYWEHLRNFFMHTASGLQFFSARKKQILSLMKECFDKVLEEKYENFTRLHQPLEELGEFFHFAVDPTTKSVDSSFFKDSWPSHLFEKSATFLAPPPFPEVSKESYERISQIQKLLGHCLFKVQLYHRAFFQEPFSKHRSCLQNAAEIERELSLLMSPFSNAHYHLKQLDYLLATQRYKQLVNKGEVGNIPQNMVKKAT